MRMSAILVFTFSVVVLFSSSALATDIGQSWHGAIRQTTKDYATKQGFNGSIAVMVNRGPVANFSGGSTQDSQPITPTHRFSSGSVGKEFTTVAILKLVEEQKLSLDDSILKYLDWLPQWAEDINVEHVLNHTSGLPKIRWYENIQTEEVIDQMTQIPELAFAPGSGYLYGNINVVVRALIVERVTGKTFTKYLEETFFKPLGMTNTVQLTQVNTREGIV
ncbi:serine hydrolase domain-containing protein [Alteromonas sp. KUL49]|uniref:serine hydrolase domain-containing protein n=1 Tax=Alteromonas sp. KUL49 TaxID=2480798 RepID=UPI00102EE33F|nr:serine hydrolase domain-containing protein [Alteromonas sp. KUL49]TAP39211.1 class A beta-lactamase-related serine hydrolase [Alteromonas sp. KUL49]GEA11986.1 hypothetical protein KUL49_23610 [Alteromonas sp. KUL49]